jgi:hypothetical protein
MLRGCGSSGIVRGFFMATPWVALQRARMEGEGSAFWLEEAENMATRVMSESVPAALSDEEKRPPELGA